MPLVLAATDFSPQADVAVAQARRLAGLRGWDLVVAHVLPPMATPASLAGEGSGQVMQELRRQLAEGARQEMARRHPDLGEAEALVAEGDPASELVALARDRGAALVVVGHGGQGKLRHAFFGSVARRLVRRSPCSVLVARPPEA